LQIFRLEPALAREIRTGKYQERNRDFNLRFRKNFRSLVHGSKSEQFPLLNPAQWQVSIELFKAQIVRLATVNDRLYDVRSQECMADYSTDVALIKTALLCDRCWSASLSTYGLLIPIVGASHCFQ
jgi:hypothetical protein